MLQHFAEQFQKNTSQIEQKSQALNKALQKDLDNIRKMISTRDTQIGALQTKCDKQARQILALEQQMYVMTRDIGNINAALTAENKMVRSDQQENKM